MSVIDTDGVELRCENAARLYKLASFTVARFHEVRRPVFVRHEPPLSRGRRFHRGGDASGF